MSGSSAASRSASPGPTSRQAFPQSDQAGTAGFQETVSLVGTAPEVAIEVSAVLKNQQRVPVGSIRGRRRWRETLAGPAPLVSVIVPCYEQAPYLEEAIESVLAQTYAQVEVVVVDDGSPDNAARVAARFPGVRLVRQPNQGLAGARNTGIRESEGELLVFLDADDRLLPRALEAGVAELRNHPEAAFAFGRYRRIGRRRDPARRRRAAASRNRPLRRLPPLQLRRRPRRRDLPPLGAGRGRELRRRAPGSRGLRPRPAPLARVRRPPARRVRRRVPGPRRRHEPGRRAMLKMTRRVLRRQRRAARQRGLRHEYREGHRFWRHYYGDPLAAHIRSAFANREWRRGLSLTGSLLRADPRALLRRGS